MKHFFLFLLLTAAAKSLAAQASALPAPRPYFTAIIVSDIDTAIQWYTEKLGFELRNRVELPERNIRQANLHHGHALIELIQIGTALFPSDLLADQPKGTQIAGVSKFGFSVADFDRWIEFLTEAGAEFLGRVVQDTVSGKKTIIVIDPDGNLVQLFEE